MLTDVADALGCTAGVQHTNNLGLLRTARLYGQR